MGEENFPKGYQKSRSVLGDVTNVLGKRGFSSVLGNLDKNSGDGNCENVDKKEREKVGAKCVLVNYKDKVKRPRTCIEINSVKRSVTSGILKIPGEKDPNSLDSGIANAVILSTTQAANISICEADVSRPRNVNVTDYADVGVTCDTDEGRVNSEGFQVDDAHASQNDENDHGADNLVMSQTGSVDGARLQESQGSICTGLKADGCSNLSAVDLIKSCSCSFCTKAAYVWLDLHYQDMKGRITAIRKSQRDASILVERNCRSKGTEKHGTGSSSTESKLEYDLRSQWRSLFLYMEKKFEHEGNQLETNLLSLTDLREKCKTELEVINGTPSED